jgi:hypothetical protein
MFKCQKCEKSADRPIRVVVERKMVNHTGGEIPVGPHGGRGSQIVREMLVCAACLASTTEAPIERAAELPTSGRTPYDPTA